jgi:lipoate-protein ligase A
LELTYSLVLPEGHPLAGDTQSLYNAAHRAIVALLESKFDAGAGQLSLCEPAGKLPRREEPFLCFLRRARGDILFRSAATGADHKIVGSAQRRTQGVVLQHGSILLGASPAAPELAGLGELSGAELRPELLAAELPGRFSTALGLNFKPSDLTPNCRQKAAELVESKYACGRWTARR